MNNHKPREVRFYKFCPGIPWKVKNKVLVPSVNRDIWKELIITKPTTAICPGYFFEALFVPLFQKVLNQYGVKIQRWIIPSYYTDLLKLFNIKNETIDERKDFFKEFVRVYRTIHLFPSPIFMDRENNLYFNMLHNYGVTRCVNGKYLDRNYDNCWKQILKNTCSYPYEMAYPFFDHELLKIQLKKFFEQKNIDIDKPYVILDNSNISYKSADERAIIPNCLSNHQIRAMGMTLWQNKKQLLVMGENVNYGVGNIFSIPNWFSVNSADLFALLLYADGICSYDPNIYLSGALLGCSRIFASGNFDDGFRLKDLQDITLKKGIKYWVEADSFELSDIMKVIL